MNKNRQQTMKLVDLNESMDIGTLYDWYISSVGDDEPVWTERHIDELFNDFYVIPKETEIITIDDKFKNNKPLTITELKQMFNEPVWVKVLDHSIFSDKQDDFDSWGMVRKSWVRIWDANRADLVVIDYDFKNYGKEWVAYRKMP